MSSPHTDTATGARPAGDLAAAWRGPVIEHADDWRLGFDTFGLDAVVARAIELGEAIDVGELALADVDDGEGAHDLAELATVMRHHLFEGCGFTLVRGLPVTEIGDTAGAVLFWMIGRQIGRPLHQNVAGDVLVRVRDEGKDFGEDGVRAYETTSHLEYHTDSSDVVGLLCRRPAARGGVSTIVSSVTVHDELTRRRPDLAPLLFEPWPELNPVDGSITALPIAARTGGGRLASRYGRKYTELAAARSGTALTAEQVATLDLYDTLANSRELALDMQFRPGDAQFLNNQTILHARTGYEDGPDPARRRELLRLWLVVPGLDVPTAFAEAGFIARTAVR